VEQHLALEVLAHGTRVWSSGGGGDGEVFSFEFFVGRFLLLLAAGVGTAGGEVERGSEFLIAGTAGVAVLGEVGAETLDFTAETIAGTLAMR
jgi:hypothetical protein